MSEVERVCWPFQLLCCVYAHVCAALQPLLLKAQGSANDTPVERHLK